MSKINTRDWHAIEQAVTGPNRVAFNTHGALYGNEAHGGPFGAGRLPDDWARTFTARRATITYVIRSYATPIAWHDSELGGWVIPAVRYSVTTSKHQGTVRTALRHVTVRED